MVRADSSRSHTNPWGVKVAAVRQAKHAPHKQGRACHDQRADRAGSWVTRSVDLGSGLGTLPGRPEMRDLVLEQEQPWRKGPPELAQEPMETAHLGSGIWS